MKAPAPIKAKSIALDLVFDAAGAFLLAVGTQVFSAPNQIAPGGITGVSVLINYLTDAPISLLVLMLNIPLLIAAWFVLGHSFALRTVRTVMISTFMLELVRGVLPAYHGDTILAALYGGVMSGSGIALVFMRGSTTGGTDVIARLLQKKLTGISVGQLMLYLNGCVLTAAAIVYGNLESALYAMISIFTSSRLLDGALYGLDMGKVLMIITEKHIEVAHSINERMGRGCTLLEGRGTYTQKDRPVLLCAMRKSQVFEVKKLVLALDPAAFIMAMEAGEVIGNGFKDAERNNS